MGASKIKLQPFPMAVLSFVFVGLSQILAGRYKRAIMFMFVTFAITSLVGFVSLRLFGLGVSSAIKISVISSFIFNIYVSYDAYKTFEKLGSKKITLVDGAKAFFIWLGCILAVIAILCIIDLIIVSLIYGG